MKRVAGKGAGAGMLQNIPKMLEITRAVVDAVKIPVTVKTRLGWDANNKIIVKLAEQLQDCGIAALTIHGRTRAQMYTGEADWTLIGEVKRKIRVCIFPSLATAISPVPKGQRCFDLYGVDAIMIGSCQLWPPVDIQGGEALSGNRRGVATAECRMETECITPGGSGQRQSAG